MSDEHRNSLTQFDFHRSRMDCSCGWFLVAENVEDVFKGWIQHASEFLELEDKPTEASTKSKGCTCCDNPMCSGDLGVYRG